MRPVAKRLLLLDDADNTSCIPARVIFRPERGVARLVNARGRLPNDGCGATDFGEAQEATLHPHAYAKE